MILQILHDLSHNEKTCISSLKARGAPAPPKIKLLAGPMVIIPTKLMCRLTCSLCWALDSDLVCPMHRQLAPNHAQQIVSGIQYVYTLVIPGTVHGHFKLPCKG